MKMEANFGIFLEEESTRFLGMFPGNYIEDIAGHHSTKKKTDPGAR